MTRKLVAIVESMGATMFLLLILCLFLVGLLIAACCDVSTMLIPNWISLSYVASFPIVALILGFSPVEIGWHFLSGAIALVICFALFAVGVFGGGDAKLIPAVMVWLGPGAVLPYVWGIALTGGVLAVLIMLTRRMVPARNVPGFLQRSVVEGPGIPYAVAIALGALWALPASPVFADLIKSTSFSALTMP
ncbi:MAG: peptidase [Ponticaulis sp.]|nr:peptidase [Ponticaulis sp.]